VTPEQAKVAIMVNVRCLLGMLEPEEQRKVAQDLAFELMRLGRQSTLPMANEEIVIFNRKDPRR
jgi:hypothetical protein